MSESGDMVKVAWEDIKYPKRWVRQPHKRTWINDHGQEITDLELAQGEHILSAMQLMDTSNITRREAMERMVFNEIGGRDSD